MRTVLLLICLAVGWPAAPAQAAVVTDEASGESFDLHPRLDDAQLRCLGAGVRKLLFVRIYALAYCVQESAVEPLAQAWTHWREEESVERRVKSLGKHPPFFAALAGAPGAKMVQMKMLRDVGAERLGDAFRDSLASVLPAAKIDRLVAAIPGDMRAGDVVTLASLADGELRIRIGTQEKRLHDLEIAEKLWMVWLGEDSVAPSLKQSLAGWAVRSEVAS